MPLTDEQSKILDKVKKILSRTVEAGATENEAALAASLAQKMLAQYNLSMMDVASKVEKVKLDVGHDYVDMGKNTAFGYEWASRLATCIGEACFCKPVIYPISRRIMFIGGELDVLVAREMWQYITTQMNTLCGYARKSTGYKGGSGPYKKFTLDFMSGCSVRVVKRIREEIIGFAQQKGSGALVKITTERNQSYAERVCDQLVKVTKKPRDSTSEGFGKGWNAGKMVELRKQVMLDDQEAICAE